MPSAAEPITVIILSWNRPLYLWACLDSLYRYTRHPARFVLVDNHSDDPGVRKVVAGFERRGMFHAVHWHETNSPKRLIEAIAQYRDSSSDYLAAVESDVAVFDTYPCWLTRMRRIMDRRRKIGILGSYVDARDFVDAAQARKIAPQLDQDTLNGLIKADSLERSLPLIPPSDPVIESFGLPGRIALIRKSTIDAIPFAKDGIVYQMMQEAGITAAVATQVRHRHLSLLNFFDYPDFDVRARDEFFKANESATPVPAQRKE